jgi:hypothetical protein
LSADPGYVLEQQKGPASLPSLKFLVERDLFGKAGC